MYVLPPLPGAAFRQTDPPSCAGFTPDAHPSLLPTKKYCDITGLPARYTDPKTKLRYHDLEVFNVIRQLVSLRAAWARQRRGVADGEVGSRTGSTVPDAPRCATDVDVAHRQNTRLYHFTTPLYRMKPIIIPSQNTESQTVHPGARAH